MSWLLLLWFAMASSQPPTEEAYNRSYNLALQYLQHKDLTNSRRLVNDLIRQADKAELHNLLGDIEEAGGHIDEAARQYELAARMDPTEKNLFDLGTDLLNHRGFKPALTVFEFAAQRFPQSARLRVALGVSHYSLGQYDDAVQSLCQAVDLDPKDTKALDFLGKMSDISPQYSAEVSKRLAAFARLYPNNAAAQYYYGLSLHKVNDPSAESTLLRAIKLQPDYPDARFELALLYQDQHFDKKAIEQLETATSQRPLFLQAHYHLARLYRRQGREDLARQEFARVEELKRQLERQP